MPAEDRPTELAIITVHELTSPVAMTVPFDAGARGEVIELIAVHYTFSNPDLVPGRLAMGLFSNPSPAARANPLVGLTYLRESPDVYGFFQWDSWVTVTAPGTGTVENFTTTEIIPLYNLIRPRRQLLAISWGQGVVTIGLRVEIYYRPKSLPKHEIDLINRKYGLYRRT